MELRAAVFSASTAALYKRRDHRFILSGTSAGSRRCPSPNCLVSASFRTSSRVAARLTGTNPPTSNFLESTGSHSTDMLTCLKRFIGTLAASIVLLQGPCPASAQEILSGVPGSTPDEISEVKKTLIEAWAIIRDTYVDPSFNDQNWDSKLKDTLKEVVSLKSKDAAYEKIRGMLATLGDPFTRIITPQEFESFRISNEGSVEGVGMLIGAEPDTGRPVVLGTIEGGPAERGGVRPGDKLLQINDDELIGLTGEAAAKKLRGKAGTTVELKIQRAVDDSLELKEIKLKRETITLSPVFSAVLPHTSEDGHLSKTGYIRLTSFSQNAAADMERAISKLEDEDADSYILDLRNNPGGLLKSGLEVAEMWLDGNDTLVNTIDREGITFPINTAKGHALTRDPLVVLVNEGSASASEILAGALHDNGRATIVGQRTYGKGKIQSVSQLDDGSALFVTVAKYLSPALHQIDKVGITPDVLCSQNKTSKVNIAETSTGRLEEDACILVAERLF